MLRRSAHVVSILVGASALVLWGAPVLAEPAITQQGSIVGQEPVAGAYKPAYRNYAGQGCMNFHCSGPGYYHVIDGTFSTRLTAYRIKDGLKRYDFYFLTIGTTVSHAGLSNSGDVKVSVADTDTAHQIDYADSPSMKADASSCKTVDFSLGYGFGPVSASTDLGSARFCSSSAHDSLSHHGATANYAISPISKVNSIYTTRLEKVTAGTHPVFRVRVTLPTDVCTDTSRLTNGDAVCVAFDDRTSTHTYRVHSDGS